VTDRRTTIKRMLAATASMSLLAQRVIGQGASTPPRAAAHGYGSDPDLSKIYRPGDLWPLLLTRAHRRTASALCDVIIPADSISPSATAVGVVDFLSEWVSAPYPDQQKDRVIILDGLAWVNAEATRRFSRGFAALNQKQQHLICDDICCEQRAKLAYAQAAKFFARFRDLTAGGFYSTPAGRKDLQYVGNLPQMTFEGPPIWLLQRLGLSARTEGGGET
jgi:hypothetical protein